MKKILSKPTACLFVLLLTFAVSFGQFSAAEAEPKLAYQPTAVGASKNGYMVVVGDFINSGDEDATITDVIIFMEVTNRNGNPILIDSLEIHNLSIWVPAGGRVNGQGFRLVENRSSFQGARWNVEVLPMWK